MNADTLMMPAEWARQSGALLTWPHGGGDWGDRLEETERAFVAMAAAIAARQRLLISCHDDATCVRTEQLLRSAAVPMDRVRLFAVPSNDIWVRDHGPITVLDGDGRPRLLDFRFNGWGRKYRFDLDDRITRTLHERGAFGATPLESVKLVLEGGSIESDGQGTLLTTTHCLLSPERNPEYDCVGLEAMFARHLGSQRVLWLKNGSLIGDDTDGHIDTLARFCDPQTIAYVKCDNADDPQYEELQRMEEELQEFRTEEGQPYRLVPLPLPAAKLDDDGGRLPATYANFLIINDAVLVPTYDDPMDEVAVERLRGCFPDREMMAIDALALIRQYGSIHCATMQLPAGVV